VHDVAVPFQSEAQRRYLFANHPDVAKRFAAETPKGAKLPAHKRKAAVASLRERMKKKHRRKPSAAPGGGYGPRGG